MRLGSFLGLVEIRTKVASVIPFLLGTIYALNHFREFKVYNFIILFISLVVFDMVTTALNNYFDYKRANKKHGYNYESHNSIVRDNLSETWVIAIIAILFTIAAFCGIILVLNTNIIVLIIGFLSFVIGISYSFGPVPISRTPFGELFSGVCMGFVIVFLSVYIHVYNQDIAKIMLENNMLSIRLNIVEILYIFLLSVPCVCGIANIMLANNICDMEDDMENKRYTLPNFIGKDNSLKLFEVLYYIAYADIIFLSVLRIIPLASLIVLLTLVPVIKNITMFYAKQSKKDTFPLAAKNFLIISMAQILIFGIATVISLIYIIQ